MKQVELCEAVGIRFPSATVKRLATLAKAIGRANPIGEVPDMSALIRGLINRALPLYEAELGVKTIDARQESLQFDEPTKRPAKRNPKTNDTSLSKEEVAKRTRDGAQRVIDSIKAST